MKLLRVILAAAAVLVCRTGLAYYAYEAPAGTVGSQTWGGALGLDFDVQTPVIIGQLGIFDSGGNGLAGTLSARLYDRDDPSAPLASLTFSAADAGTLNSAFRFKDLVTPVSLPAGFHGCIVADGFSGSDPNGNSSPPATTDSGGDALAFVGTARYANSAGVYPTNLDGGPPARYLAGSFAFTVDSGPPPPPPPAQADGPVTLKNHAAERSQGGWPVSAIADGSLTSGWGNGGSGSNTDIVTPAGKGARFTISLYSGNTFNVGGSHTLGRFRLSVTGDPRTDFADGRIDGGDVTANWTVLTPLDWSSTGPSSLSLLADGSLLASGGPGDYETYTILAESTLPLITGFRLEAFTHESLPLTGPGRSATNGNFVVYEFGVDYLSVPEPASLAVFLAAAAAILRRR
ncbi:MAG: hypothetical protein BWZ02_00638 [Lentisphaerae bacterium ADurb.BinA184]|nr:MAG: hypothetical protein BWZ02_00638 [Lentisphaerae bacterium ADurb.BinA184]